MSQSVRHEATHGSVTSLLARLHEGDEEAFDELFPIVYQRLRDLARAQRGRWQGNHTLNTTALVHEAYIKLVGGGNRDWKDRSHFLAVASRAMRQILIDYARSKQTAKRGEGRQPLSFEEVRHEIRSSTGLTEERIEGLVALDDSLRRLEAEKPRQSRIVECRFFGDMTIKDTAEVLGVSPATVNREWAVAKAWLHRDVKRSLGAEG